MSDLRKRALNGPVTTSDVHFRTQAWGDNHNEKPKVDVKHKQKWDYEGSAKLLGIIGATYALLVGADAYTTMFF